MYYGLNINLIFSTVSLFHKVRKWNKTNIKNYVEIYKIRHSRNYKKRINFFKGNYQNIVGKTLKLVSKSPDIIIENNFTKPLKLYQKLIKN